MQDIRVVVAEYSKSIASILNNASYNNYRINVVFEVSNGIDAYKAITKLKPDFFITEISLNAMGAIELIKLFKKENIKINIIIISLSSNNEDLIDKVINLGALDIINKPKNINNIESFKIDIIKKIINILEKQKNNILIDSTTDNSKTNISVLNNIKKEKTNETSSKLDNDIKILPHNDKIISDALYKVSKLKLEKPKLIAIGISTGGPRALRILLPNLPKDFPLPILISQHIPKDFTYSLVSSLNDICKIKIKEANIDEEILPSIVYISPGDKNMGIYLDSMGKIRIKFYQDTENQFIYTPCIDYLFNTINDALKNKAIAIIMTGMGNDGTSGMKKLYNNKNLTIAQNKETSTIYGMPKSAVENNVATLVLSLYDISEFLIQYITNKA